MCEAGNEQCLLSMIVETHRHSALSPINSAQVLGAMLTEISRALLEADVNIRLGVTGVQSVLFRSEGKMAAAEEREAVALAAFSVEGFTMSVRRRRSYT